MFVSLGHVSTHVEDVSDEQDLWAPCSKEVAVVAGASGTSSSGDARKYHGGGSRGIGNAHVVVVPLFFAK